MTEEHVVAVESTATPEQQAAAEKLGWIPPARFKGDPERFIDAADYIERGETVLPIVKKQLADTKAELAAVSARAAATDAALKAAQAAIDQIEERHSVDTQKAVEAAKRQVKQQLEAASEAGDHAAVAELTEQMVELQATKDAPPPKKEAAPLPVFKPDPDLVAWNEENAWYGKDRKKTGLALGIAEELRASGETSKGREFYDKVGAELNKYLGGFEAPRGDKVEGARNGGDGETRQGGKKSYNNLPSDAKAACDADGKARIGPTKRYKTQAEQRAAWSEIYFGQES